MRRLLLATLAAASLASASHAAPVVDQENIAPPVQQGGDPLVAFIGNNLSNDLDLAQLQFVTAGMSGQLSQVDLQLSKFTAPAGVLNFGTGRLVIGKDVVFDAGGQISSGTKLADISFAVSSIGDFNNLTSFDTSALNIFLNAGDQFVIAVLPSQDSFELFRWGFSGDVYAGGAGFVGFQPSATADDDFTWSEKDGQVIARDYGFRTWMNAVPEPGTWAMMIVGFGLVGGMMRHRKVATAIA